MTNKKSSCITPLIKQFSQELAKRWPRPCILSCSMRSTGNNVTSTSPQYTYFFVLLLKSKLQSQQRGCAPGSLQESQL